MSVAPAEHSTTAPAPSAPDPSAPSSSAPAAGHPLAQPIAVGSLGHPTFPVAMVTGHRPKDFDAEQRAWVKVRLVKAAWRLRSVYGTTVGVSGMALGADTWWAEAVLAAGMDLHTHVPFEDQAKTWPVEDQALWRALRGAAAVDRVIGGQAYDVKMLHARNDTMLRQTREGGGLVVAVWNGKTSGGTYSAVTKARRAGQPLLVIDPSAGLVRSEGW